MTVEFHFEIQGSEGDGMDFQIENWNLRLDVDVGCFSVYDCGFKVIGYGIWK